MADFTENFTPRPTETRAEKAVAKATNAFMNRLSSPPPPNPQPYIDRHGGGGGFGASQEAIENAIDELRDLAPALNADQKAQIYDLLGEIDPDDSLSLLGGGADLGWGNGTVGIVDIDTITAQFLLVQSIRKKVMDPRGVLRHKASARELTSLVNAINSVVNLFMRHADKVRSMQEVAQLKRAVSYALEKAPAEVRDKFLSAMEGGSQPTDLQG
jgi:hypothetical protein